MPPAFSIPDDGWVVVELAGVEKRIDLYRAYNDVTDATESTRDQPTQAYHAALQAVAAGLGFPEVSCRAAHQFALAVADQVAALKKADAGGPTPGSPGPTEAPPSASPAEPS